MNKISHQEIRNYYNQLAETDNLYIQKRWQKNHWSKLAYKQTKNFILNSLNELKPKQALEVGCGPGTWTDMIAKKSKNLISIDISEKMISQAKKNVKSKNVIFLANDFHKYNFKTQKFDSVFIIRALEYFKSKKEVIKKSASLLKDNGNLIIVTKNPSFLPKRIAKTFNKNFLKSTNWFLPKQLTSLICTYQKDIHQDWIGRKRLERCLFKNNFKIKKMTLLAIFTFLPIGLLAESYGMVAQKK